MNSDRLWPVLLVLSSILIGVSILEWVAENREEPFELIQVFDSAGAEGEAGEERQSPWQSSRPINAEHARARQLQRRGDVEEALAVYQTLMSDHRATVGLLTDYAYALRRVDRCSEAGVLMDQALMLAPDDGAVCLSAALTFNCLREYEQAAEAFEEAVRLRPNHTETRLAYAEFLMRRDNVDRAVAILEPATRSGTNEERAEAYAAFGRALFTRGDRQPATGALNEAVERAPARVAIWMSVARTYLSSDEPAYLQLALEHATQATRLAPELATAHSALARSYEKLGMTLEAIAAYRKAATLDSSYEYVRVRLIRLALEEEEDSLAARVGEQLLEIDPDNEEYHFLTAQAAMRIDEVDRARQLFERAIELRGGQYAEAWYQLAEIERSEENWDGALAALQRAVEIEPEYDDAWVALGLVHVEQDEYALAEVAFRRSIEIEPTNAEAWTNLGRCHSALDEFDLAVEAYQTALRIDGDDRVVRLRLGAALRRAGRAEEAIELYEQLVQDEPLYVSAWYNAGIAYSAVGNNAQARASYERALSIDPSHRNSMNNLGLLEAREGQFELALVHLTDALDREPSDHSLRLRVAHTALAAGDRQRCAREAARVLNQDPDNTQAQAVLRNCE